MVGIDGGSGSSWFQRLLFLIPDTILLIGLLLGWYSRWSFHHSSVLLFVLTIGIVLYCFHALFLSYCNSRILAPLIRMEIGCLLGIVAFFDDSYLSQHYKSVEDVCRFFLIGSVLAQILLETGRRCLKCKDLHNNRCFSTGDLWELLGIAVACVLSGSNGAPLLCVWFAFACCQLSLRLKSISALLVLLFLAVSLEMFIFPQFQIPINPYATLCILGRLSCAPILDILMSSASRLDRWRPAILARRIWQKLFLLLVVALEVAMFCVHASVIGSHQEWIVVVPLFVISSVLWCLMHISFLMVIATLIDRYSPRPPAVGYLTSDTTTEQLKRMLGARGLRYFSLIAQRLMHLCVVTTVIIGAICWTTRTPCSHSLLIAAICLEVAFTELLSECSNALGGTCIGYSLIAPVAVARNDGLVSVLPPNFVQEAQARSTQTLDAVVQFLSQCLITNFGCDWSTSGVQELDLEKKLRLFFSQVTYEGPRYDSYLLYFSGPVDGEGNWALAQDNVLTYEKVLELWKESHELAEDERASKHNQNRSDSIPRLIIICDTAHSDSWLRPVRRTRGLFIIVVVFIILHKAAKHEAPLYIALQTCKFGKSAFSSSSQFDKPLAIGQFTQLWGRKTVAKRSSSDLSDHSPTKARSHDPDIPLVQACYSVSRLWSDFSFRAPSMLEVREYWFGCLPQCTHPVLGVFLTLMSLKLSSIFCCCTCVVKMMKRWRLRVWPPVELDTGHGFRFISGSLD